MKITKTTIFTISICTGIILHTAFARNNEVLTWTGNAGDNDWNGSSVNWKNEGDGSDNIPIAGDLLNFDGTDATVGNIMIDSSGVDAAGLLFSGNKDYVFTGGGIHLDAASTTLPTGYDVIQVDPENPMTWVIPSANGVLVVGGKSNEDGYIGVFNPDRFYGVVDFTGITGTNSFSGIHLSSGTLKISNTTQLGTTFDKITFGGYLSDISDIEVAMKNNGNVSDAIITARASGDLGTLQIVEDMTLTTGNGFLSVGDSQKGSIDLAAGKTLTFDGIGMSFGSADLSFLGMTAGEGAKFIFKNINNLGNSGGGFAGAMTLGGLFFINNAEFTNNSATNAGGAIFNAGNYGAEGYVLVLSNVTFSENTSGAGGAIWTQQGGVITLNDFIFENNSATIQGIYDNKGGAIFNRGSTINLNVTGSNTSLFSGNKDGGGANSIYFHGSDGITTILNVNTDAEATLDMHDPMSGDVNSSSIAIKKDGGSGVWKLGGTSSLDNPYYPDLGISFDINAGTLYLYRDGEEAGVTTGNIVMTGDNTSFSVGSGAMLSVGGGNSISTQTSITFSAGSSLGFNLSTLGTTVGLSVSTGSLNALNGNGLAFGVNFTSWKDGSFTLLETNTNGYFNGVNFDSVNVMLNGKALSSQVVGNERYIAAFRTDGASSGQLLADTETRNIVNSWAGSDGNWDGNSMNWQEPISGTYIKGDAVNFDGTGNRNISVGSDITVSGMYISGNNDYSFSGERITGSNSGTTLSGDVAGGKLILGAKANTNQTLSDAAFTGTVTFSNETNFTSIDINSGTLHAAHNNALGLANVTVGTSGILKGNTAVGGILIVENGGIVAPGNSAGTITLTVPGNTFQSGSIYEWELLDNGTSGDSIILGSGATLSVESGAILNLVIDADYSDSFWTENHDFDIIIGNGGNSITGLFDTYFVQGENNEYGKWTVLQDGQSIVAQWTVIPEPSTYGIMSVAAFASLAFLRRRVRENQ